MFGLTPYRKNQGIANRDGGFRDFDRFFEDFFNDSFFPALYNGASQMKVDIKESEKEYVVEAELPGVNKEDINIDLEDNQLTVGVQRNEEVNNDKENYICRERRSSSFSRSFYVDNIKNENVNAKFENGVLTIVLPKKDTGFKSTRKIDIQ